MWPNHLTTGKGFKGKLLIGGFTLIEMLITMSILAALSVMVAEAIRQSAQQKEKISKQIDLVAPVRDTQKLILSDIQNAVHVVDTELNIAKALEKAQKLRKKEKEDAAKKKQGGADGAGGSDGGSSEEAEKKVQESAQAESEDDAAESLPYLPAHKSKVRISPETHFIGKEEAMHFVAKNQLPNLGGKRFSENIEVGYFLDSCVGPKQNKKQFETGKCLFRRMSTLPDSVVEVGGVNSELLAHVTEFKLSYYLASEDEWFKEWNSTDKGPAQTKGRYPDAVQVRLQLEVPTGEKGAKKKVGAQFVAPVIFANPGPLTEEDGAISGSEGRVEQDSLIQEEFAD